MLQESGKRRLTIRRNMSSSISLPSFRLPSKAKFWKKRRSEDLGDSDPSYRAIYLGNVLTGWAKGKFQMLCIHFQSYFVLHGLIYNKLIIGCPISPMRQQCQLDIELVFDSHSHSFHVSTCQ